MFNFDFLDTRSLYSLHPIALWFIMSDEELMFQMDDVDTGEDRRILSDAYDRWSAPRRALIEARREIADQRAVMTAQAKIISLLWATPHTDDIVADYSSLRALFPMQTTDKMIFSSD